MDNYFIELNQINVNEHTEKKNNLTYLSWSWAWAEVKKKFPDTTYTVYENSEGWNYFTDGRTCWVKTGMTINGIEHIEYLPVMDYRNRSIPFENVTSMDVNKTIQRSLTKCAARHGLGLYVYAGEDLPEQDTTIEAEDNRKKAKEQLEPQVTTIKDGKVETKQKPKFSNQYAIMSVATDVGMTEEKVKKWITIKFDKTIDELNEDEVNQVVVALDNYKKEQENGKASK